MSLFEKLNNKRYNLQEGIDSKGNITPNPGDKAKEKSILRNYNKQQKDLSKDISQRVTAQDRQQQLYNRAYDAYDDGDLGNPSQSKTTVRKKVTASSGAKVEIPSGSPEMGGESKKFASRNRTPSPVVTATSGGKTKSLKPKITGDVLTNKGVNQADVSKQAKEFTKKVNKQNKNLNPPTRANYPKTRPELIAKRAEYGIDRKGNISDAGVKRYAQKTKQLSSGSNIPAKVTAKDLKVAKIRAVGGEKIKDSTGKVVGTTTGKYGGRLPNVRGKNQPSLADVKAKIDAKNPTYTSPITGGKLPVKQVRDPDLKRMSPADRATYKEIKRTTPKGGIPKWMKDFDKQYPDKSKLGSFKNPPPTVLKVVKPDLANPTGFKPVDTKTKEGAKIFKKQVTGSQLVAKTPAQLEPIPKPKSKNVFSKIKAYVKGIGPKVRNKLKDPGAPEFRTYTRPDGSRVFTRNKLSKNIVKRTFQKIPKRGKVGAILAGGLLTVSAINALLPKGKKSNTGDGNRRALLPFGGNKPGDYKPVPIKLSLTSARKNKSGDYVKTPQLPVNNNPNVQNFVNRTAQAKRNT